MISYPTALPYAEQAELCVAAQAGDEASRNRLIWHSMRFVAQRAKRIAFMEPEHIEDFVNDGVIGLVTAIAKFDPGKGVRFITYARYWVDVGIWRGVWRVRETKEADEKRRRLLTDYRAATDAGCSHEEAVSAVAADTGKKVSTVDAVVYVLSRPTHASLDATIGDSDTAAIEATPSDDEGALRAMERSEVQASVQKAVERLRRGLCARDRAVLDRRVLATDDDRPSLREVGAEVDRTGEWARLREKSLTESLRAALSRVNNA